MTGFSASCRKARPLAAPKAIFTLVAHVRDTENPEDESKIDHSFETNSVYNMEWRIFKNNDEIASYF